MSAALWIIMVFFGVAAFFVHQRGRNVWLRVIFMLAQIGFFLWAWLNYEEILGPVWLYVLLALVLMGTVQEFVQRHRRRTPKGSGPH